MSGSKVWSVKETAWLIALEGWVALLLLLRSTSVDSRRLLVGFSFQRYLAAAGVSLVVIGFTLLAVLATRRPAIAARWQGKLGDLGSREKVLPIVLGVILASAHVLAIYVMLLDADLAPWISHYWRARMSILSPAVIWLVAVPSQLILIHVLPPGALLRAAFSEEGRSWAVLLPAVAGGLLQVTLLALRVRIFQSIPGWFWSYLPKNIDPTDLIFIPVLAASIFVTGWISKSQRGTRYKLIVLVAMAWALQMAYGLYDGSGLNAIRLNYAEAYIALETEVACAVPDLAEALTRYEGLYAADFWYGTKPPGLLAFYVGLRDLARPLFALLPGSTCFSSFTWLQAFLFPILSALLVVPIWRLGLALGLSDRRSLLAGVLFSSAPAFQLMPMLPDQFLYPWFFVGGALLTVLASERGSVPLALAAGGVVLGGTLVSFSLLAVVPLVGLWLAQEWVRGNPAVRRGVVTRTLAVVAVLVAGYLLIAVVFDYDPLLRFRMAMAQHRRIKEYDASLTAAASNLILNNLDFALWIGFGLAALALSSGVRIIRQFWQGRVNKPEVLYLAFGVTYLLLNFLGQTRGETGRLWIMMMPVAAMASAQHLPEALEPFERNVQVLVGLQLTASLAMFLLMDFR